MTFAAVTFAETSFAADNRFLVVGTFPIFPFNGDVLTFVMSLNQELDFDISITQTFENELVMNTGIDAIGLINTRLENNLNINQIHQFNLIR